MRAAVCRAIKRIAGMQSENASAVKMTRLKNELSDAGHGLDANHDLLRGVLESSGDCIKVIDLDGNLQFMSEGGKRVMEVDDFGPLKGCPWPSFWIGEGHAEAKAAVEAAKRGNTARFKGPANTAKGNERYWDVSVSPIFGADGAPSHILSISRDITDEWRAVKNLEDAAERQSLLAGELQHRIKNTLAMVGAIANQTMRGDSVSAARDAFNARLVTLSHAHDILMQTSWASAPIKDVIEGALAAHQEAKNRIAIDGPALMLLPKQALALAVAIHELATNAAKYGALSTEGKVEVTWSNDCVAGFRLFWTESGGPSVVEPDPKKKGFGSRLIEKMLASDFGGKVWTHYRPGGLVCELEAPSLDA